MFVKRGVNVIKVNNNIKNVFSIAYLCFMVVYMIVREVLPLNYLIDNVFVSVIVFFMGFALVLWDLLTERNCLKGRAIDFFIAFIIISVFSSIINYKYGIAANIKCIAAMVLEYFVFFPNGFKENSTKTLKIILNTLIITLFIFNTISVGMYFFSIDYSVFFHFTRDQGFDRLWGRLFGIYNDPNVACYISLVAVFVSVYFMYKYKKVWAYILYSINIIMQMLFVTLVLSRSATLIILVVPFISALYPFICYIKTNKKIAFSSLLLAVVVSAALYGTNTAIKKGVPYVKAALLNSISVSAREKVVTAYDKMYLAGNIKIFNIEDNHVAKDSENSDQEPGGEQDKTVEVAEDEDIHISENTNQGAVHALNNSMPQKTEDSKIKVEVEEIERNDKKEDYSNGRFDRWKGGIEVFKTTPIFGTSPRNAILIAKERTPDTVMGKYGWVTHCSYLEVLVNTGILGAIAMFGALIYIAVLFVKAALKKGFDLKLYIVFLCFITIAVGVFFVSDVFFVFTINSLLFFYLLGFLYDSSEPDQNGIAYKVFNRLKKVKN